VSARGRAALLSDLVTVILVEITADTVRAYPRLHETGG